MQNYKLLTNFAQLDIFKMIRNNIRTLSGLRLAAVFSVALCLFACGKLSPDFDTDAKGEKPGDTHVDFVTTGSYSKVLILYSAGYNSLSEYLAEDIADLAEGYVPSTSSEALLVFSRLPKRSGSYSDKASPVLFRMYSNSEGKVCRDTLVVYPEGTHAASSETINEVLTYIKNRYPCDHYGMIFSSHASGWMPPGYYNEPSKYEGSSINWVRRRGAPFPYVELPYDPSKPAVRSVGQDLSTETTSTTKVTYELEIKEFAEAIPMHFDYILFDACLMGCIEVAYELRDVCDMVQFSPAEVLAGGLDYTTLTTHLLGPGEADIKGVAKDYFDFYDKQSGDFRSATITVVDCTKASTLFELSASLIKKYHDAIMNVNPDSVQQYFRYGRCYFYDMEDIFIKAGISESERTALEAAIDECVPYRAATPSFIGDFDIKIYSGFSMYLPSIATYFTRKDFTYLNSFYKSDVSWNTLTTLVR